jgi:ketosteroid isomerase-like protein
MSEENVEIVRRFYEAYNGGNRDGWTRLLGSEVELIPLGVELTGGYARGAESVARAQEAFTAHFASYEISPERFWDVGDQVVVVLRRSARSARSAALIEDHFCQLITLRDGCIVRFQSFRRVNEALEAAGLRE